MKRKINLICSVLALFCFISMFVPVIAPRFPAGEYYAPAGSYERSYYYTGDYYLAKSYWTITDFASQSIAGRIILSFDQALLLIWALLSVRGESGKKGVIPALLNLVVVGVVVIKMLGTMWSCRWGVLAVMALNMVASVVMAANADTVPRSKHE